MFIFSTCRYCVKFLHNLENVLTVTVYYWSFLKVSIFLIIQHYWKVPSITTTRCCEVGRTRSKTAKISLWCLYRCFALFLEYISPEALVKYLKRLCWRFNFLIRKRLNITPWNWKWIKTMFSASFGALRHFTTNPIETAQELLD